MILREALILIGAFAGFAVAVGFYLFAAHGSTPMKEVLSTAFAATFGLELGRLLERRLLRGRLNEGAAR